MCHAAIDIEDALTERLFQSTIQSLEMFSVYLGKRLGLYQALADHGPLTDAGLADHAGIAKRYAREWLEQQAVAGFLVAVDHDGTAATRAFQLPAAHAGVLVEEDHGAHIAPFAEMLVGIAGALPEVVTAYQTGEGVAYERYGADFRHGQGGINRPAFTSDLVKEWLPAIPDLHARLTSTNTAKIADVGCGEGWSTMAVADAFPDMQVTGFDLDPPSIAAARDHALARDSRARFRQCDASDMADEGPFDLIMVLESLHDMSQPTRALAAMRKALSPGGMVLVVDERVAEEFTSPGDDVERMMYGWSVSHCLPVAMVDQPSEGIGTAIRISTVQDCSERAGFGQFEVLPIENDLFRFYRLQNAA